MKQRSAGRFLVVGVSAAMLQFFVACLLMWVGGRPALSAMIAFAMAFLYAYSMHRRWTFASGQEHAVLLPRYALTQAVCALVGALAAEVAFWIWRWPSQGLALTAVLVSSALAYVMSLYWVFRP